MNASMTHYCSSLSIVLIHSLSLDLSLFLSCPFSITLSPFKCQVLFLISFLNSSLPLSLDFPNSLFYLLLITLVYYSCIFKAIKLFLIDQTSSLSCSTQRFDPLPFGIDFYLTPTIDQPRKPYVLNIFINSWFSNIKILDFLGLNVQRL